jgi:hypothetical protein
VNILDIRLIAALISTVVTIIIFIVLQFVIEPMRQRRKMREESYKNLYAPLYGIVIARDKLGATFNPKNEILLANAEDQFINREAMEKIIYDNAGYASLELINVWAKYITSIGNLSPSLTSEFVAVILKDYHSLRKKLGLIYNSEELKTGIPDDYEHLRNKSEDPA